MKLAVVGSRGIDNSVVSMTLDSVYEDNPGITEVVSGGAYGVDRFAATWAKKNSLKVTEHLPDWDTHGKKAGFIRNEQIIRDSDCVVAIWDGQSNGTANSIQWAKKLNKPIFVIIFDPYSYEDENGNDCISWEFKSMEFHKNDS